MPHARALRYAMADVWALPSEEKISKSGPDWLLLLCDEFPAEEMANFLMVLWRNGSVRNGVLKAGGANLH